MFVLIQTGLSWFSAVLGLLTFLYIAKFCENFLKSLTFYYVDPGHEGVWRYSLVFIVDFFVA